LGGFADMGKLIGGDFLGEFRCVIYRLTSNIPGFRDKIFSVKCKKSIKNGIPFYPAPSAYPKKYPIISNYKLTKVLLQFSTKDEWHLGEYKKHPNHVAAFDSKGNQIGIIFETARPAQTPLLMESLVSLTHKR
jgi:hypothetical protein